MALFAEGKVERGAAIRLCMRPDFAAVSLHDALNQRQADAGAFKFLRGMQAGKNAEQLAGVIHVKPDAVVAHIPNAWVLIGLAADFDDGLRALAGEFDRVVEQVKKHFAQSNGIGMPGG